MIITEEIIRHDFAQLKTKADVRSGHWIVFRWIPNTDRVILSRTKENFWYTSLPDLLSAIHFSRT